MNKRKYDAFCTCLKERMKVGQWERKERERETEKPYCKKDEREERVGKCRRKRERAFLAFERVCVLDSIGALTLCFGGRPFRHPP